jgi:hypothetical protein
MAVIGAVSCRHWQWLRGSGSVTVAVAVAFSAVHHNHNSIINAKLVLVLFIILSIIFYGSLAIFMALIGSFLYIKTPPKNE